ncbi:MAG: thioredoxin-like domain-containing protein [Acidobacteriia bacterium]|nr:thioredoxin-like domain-containing protein [Terriglobia bacterium]
MLVSFDMAHLMGDKNPSVQRRGLKQAEKWTSRVWLGVVLALVVVALLAVSPFKHLVESVRGAAMISQVPNFDDWSDPGGSEVRQVMSGYKQTVHAPDFSGGVAWLNVQHPLSIKDLHGKVVLVDFWTYCCINCMHVIPTLRKLEEKYDNDLAVIGVHSAKFQNEKESQNIREAILRYEIHHPVVNDANFAIWRAYGVNAWPTLVLIDPDGYIVGKVPGEGSFEVLDQAIGFLVNRFKAENKIVEKPLPLALEKDKQPPSVLSFPGKILADEKSNRLFISDSNHNRILVATLDGNVLDIAGSGAEGRVDGSFAQAQFHHPQGMAFDAAAQILWIADTENHSIRKLDLAKRTVETAAGTGHQASWGEAGGPATSTALNSPWDLALVDGKIYIANAGSHQLWVFDPQKKTAEPFAGSGMENIVDAGLSFAALAQPSGLTTDGKRLFFADSEASAVRYADLGRPNQVHTLIGEGLFEFGDIDGLYPAARLQHPLGVAYYNGKVYVADTYNHKIRVVDPEKRSISTLLGNGKPGVGTESHPQFYEPGGLSFAGNKLYIADTDNHAIRVADLKTKQVTTLQLYGFDELASGGTASSSEDSPFTVRARLAVQSVKAGADSKLIVDLKFPEGFHLNPIAPLSYQVKKIQGDSVMFTGGAEKASLKNASLPLTIPFKSPARDGKTTLELAMTVYYCREDNQGLCYIKSLNLTQPLDIAASSSETIVPIKVDLK